jgi:hypothetical protein
MKLLPSLRASPFPGEVKSLRNGSELKIKTE